MRPFTKTLSRLNAYYEKYKNKKMQILNFSPAHIGLKYYFDVVRKPGNSPCLMALFTMKLMFIEHDQIKKPNPQD